MGEDMERLDIARLPSLNRKDDFQPLSQTVIEPIPEFDESTDIRDYLEVILRRKWLILTIFSVSVITAFIVSLTMKPKYRAMGRIELSAQSPRVTKFEGMMLMGGQADQQQFMQTQVKLLKSESLADLVIKKLDLAHNPAFNPPSKKPGATAGLINSITGTVEGLFGRFPTGKAGSGAQTANPALARVELKQAMENQLLGGLAVKPVRGTTICSLEYTSTDPALSKNIINSLIREFMAWDVDKKIQAATVAKQRLGEQIEIARIQLEKAETKLNDYAQRAGIVSLSKNLNLIYTQLESANKAYSAIQTKRMTEEALYDQVMKSKKLPAVLEGKLIKSLRTSYDADAAKYSQLSATFKGSYPDLVSLKAKMDEIQQNIQQEEQRVRQNIAFEYLSTVAKEKALKKDMDAKKALAMALNDRATQYKILDREVQTYKQIHQSLLERDKEIDAEVGTELGNITVVDYARLPLSPYSPRIPRNILFSALIGMALGLGAAFFLERLDNTVKRIEEFSSRFDLPVLGVLPTVAADDLPNIGSLVRTNPKADFSEALRTAKISIQLSSSMDRPPKLLFITSSTASEGKSTIAVNLALAFASEERVLLVEGDLRKPNLRRLLGKDGNGASLARGRGLSNYLTGMSEDIVQETGHPNLSAVFAGTIPPNPSELLASNRMREFIAEMYQRFDRIIIDGPPAPGFADALILGHYADGVIFVSVLGQTHREALRVYRKSLDNVGGRMIGVIVNKYSQIGHYGYYKYYRYYHYQSSYYQQQAGPQVLTSGDGNGEKTGARADE